MLLRPPYYFLYCVVRRSYILNGLQNVVVGSILCSTYANIDEESSHGNWYYKPQVMRFSLGATTCIWEYKLPALRLHGRWTMVFTSSSFLLCLWYVHYLPTYSASDPPQPSKMNSCAATAPLLLPTSRDYLKRPSCNYKVLQYTSYNRILNQQIFRTHENCFTLQSYPLPYCQWLTMPLS